MRKELNLGIHKKEKNKKTNDDKSKHKNIFLEIYNNIVRNVADPLYS